MSSDYTGLHGRSPYEADHPHPRGAVIDERYDGDHAVPEGWEELNRGICPWCGRTVAWDEKTERWVLDDTLTVLVLTHEEIQHLKSGLVQSAIAADEGSRKRGWSAADRAMSGRRRGAINMLERAVESMYDLNRPFEEAAGE